MRSPPSGEMVLVIFRRFLDFRPFFGPYLDTAVKNAKYIKVAPKLYNELCNKQAVRLHTDCVFVKIGAFKIFFDNLTEKLQKIFTLQINHVKILQH